MAVTEDGRSARTAVWIRDHRAQTLVFLLVIVVFAALWPLVRTLDRAEDRPKAMYRDVVEMERAQMKRLAAGERPVPVSIDGKGAVKVGKTVVHVSAGVHLRVTSDGAEFCVRGWNDSGDVSDRRCSTIADREGILGGLS